MMPYRILKYRLSPGTKTAIDLPYNSRILTVQEQDGFLTMWVLVDSNTGTGRREFYAFATGIELTDNIVNLKYIATVQQQNGLVWHIFE